MKSAAIKQKEAARVSNYAVQNQPNCSACSELHFTGFKVPEVEYFFICGGGELR